MKTKILIFTFFCLALFTACEKDGELITLSGIDVSGLVADEKIIELSKENASSQVLGLAWNEGTLTISNDSMSIPSSVPMSAIELSDSSHFNTITQIVPEGTVYSFFGAELNTIAKDMGFTPGVSTPMFIRINTAYGKNTDPVYSNTDTVYVSCYFIDMSIGFILDVDGVETGDSLYAPNSDGEYFGFTGPTAWGNWFLREGDDTKWGNLGVDGNEFVISNDEASHWNFWYPGLGGCYYTTLSTTNEEWTATYIPSLTVSGAVDTEMTFDRQNVKWYVSFTTTTDNAAVKVSSVAAALYNRSTGTDDASAIAKEIAFIPGSDNSLSIDWNSASAEDFICGTAGDYTLSLYLSDPMNWRYEISSGIIVPDDPLSEFLYLPGIDDGTSGAWTFDNYLRLLSEDDSTFAAAVWINSLYGYNMSLVDGEWTDVYKMGATEGTLEFKGADNITAPDSGLYFINADLKNLTYSHTAVTSLSYAGFNDDWAMVEMTESAVTGVYSSSVTINDPSQWGAKLYLSGSWDDFYGGSEGALTFLADGFTDDADIATGTYDLVADITSQTYVLLGNEVYIAGLNDIWDFTSVVLTKSSTGIYAGSVTISSVSSDGIQIHLDDSWNRYFGGSFDSMVFKGGNIIDDQSLANGTYNVTVDFINNTCTFVAQ